MARQKFSILRGEASTLCASETQNFSCYECLESESGTVFNIYPPSPILKLLIHRYFLNAALPSFKLLFPVS